MNVYFFVMFLRTHCLFLCLFYLYIQKPLTIIHLFWGHPLNISIYAGQEEGSGGVALGLVSALQKWANSLETKMVGLKDSNVQLIQVWGLEVYQQEYYQKNIAKKLSFQSK